MLNARAERQAVAVVWLVAVRHKRTAAENCPSLRVCYSMPYLLLQDKLVI